MSGQRGHEFGAAKSFKLLVKKGDMGVEGLQNGLRRNAPPDDG